jgi:guanylate kinase
MKHLFLIYAPSAAGKTTVEKWLDKNIDNLQRFVSTTTREPRIDEVNGVDYHFVSINEFNFDSSIEAQIQIGSDTNWKYGISTKEFEKINKFAIMSVISLQYVKDIADSAKRNGFNVSVIYLNVSVEERIRRMKARGETSESISKRLDFEDKYSLNEIKEKIPDIFILNGERPPEEIQRDLKLKIGGVL